jgi:hypothetical protein
MKVIFSLLFAILIQVSYAQKYQPLVEEGKYWIYDHYDLGPCYLKYVRAKEIRYFSGDTIINGYMFKKLVSSFVPLNKSPLEISSKVTLCLMREDTIERKVYVINNNDFVFPCFDGQEVCIWDFGLSVGDTIRDCAYEILNPLDFGENNYNLVDSILYLKNHWGYVNRHFYTIGVRPAQCNDPVQSVLSYVEGFGTEDGPIIAFYGIILKNYCEGTLEECNIISSTQNQSPKSQSQIQLIPNPAHDLVTFHLDKETNQLVNQYLIRDLQGKIVKDASPVIVGKENTISTLGLPSGMYIIQFLTDGKMVDAEKLVIAH